MQAPAAPLPLTDADRDILNRLAVSQTASLRLVLRARVLLMAGDGVANSRIAERVGVSVGTVRAWRARFRVDGVAKLGKVASGRGRKSTITQAQVDEIVDLTRNSVPDGETHWSCRTMADRVGVCRPRCSGSGRRAAPSRTRSTPSSSPTTAGSRRS
jgi:transposase